MTDPMEAFKDYGDRISAERRVIIEQQREHATGTIRSLFLLNGGAAIGLLSLVGTILSKDTCEARVIGILLKGVRLVIPCFGWGLIATAALSSAAYLNYTAIVARIDSPGRLYDAALAARPPSSKGWAHVQKVSFWIAPLLTFASAFCFVRGGLFVAQAMVRTAHLFGS